MKATLDPVGDFVVRYRVVLLALLLVLVLAGCAHKPEAPALPPLKARMPSDVRADCDPLPNPPPRGSTMGDLYGYTDELMSQYGECAMRDRAKRRWVESQGM